MFEYDAGINHGETPINGGLSEEYQADVRGGPLRNSIYTAEGKGSLRTDYLNTAASFVKMSETALLLITRISILINDVNHGCQVVHAHFC